MAVIYMQPIFIAAFHASISYNMYNMILHVAQFHCAAYVIMLLWCPE